MRFYKISIDDFKSKLNDLNLIDYALLFIKIYCFEKFNLNKVEKNHLFSHSSLSIF